MLNKRKLTYSVLILMLLLAVILAFIILHGKKGEMRVVFLDVGQGDSILISQGSKQILIDGGKDGKLLLEKLGRHIPFWDRKIEAVIETHPDADHIGGLIEIFRTHEISAVMKTNARSESQTFKALEEAVAAEGSQIVEAQVGQKIILSEDAQVEIIFPFEKIVENTKDTNAGSVVMRLSFGENSFLLTGDLPGEQEKEILARGIDIKSDVLKVSHHGSKYSSSDDFLDRVAPRDAIVSVGKNNSYGHPHADILKRLMQRGISVFRTDERGDIIYECQSPTLKCKSISN